MDMTTKQIMQLIGRNLLSATSISRQVGRRALSVPLLSDCHAEALMLGSSHDNGGSGLGPVPPPWTPSLGPAPSLN